MKYVLRLHARSDENLPIANKHSRLIRGLTQLGGVWGLPPCEYPAPETGRELSARFELGRFLGKGIKGFVSYRYRGGLRDESDCDDYIDLEFDPKRVDYVDVVHRVFPAFIRSFGPYLAYVGHEEFTYLDFDRSRDFNHRDDVLRIHPVNYFDDQLCNRAFQLSAGTVVRRVLPHVARAELINDGVFMVITEIPLSVESAQQIDQTIRASLTSSCDP